MCDALQDVERGSNEDFVAVSSFDENAATIQFDKLGLVGSGYYASANSTGLTICKGEAWKSAMMRPATCDRIIRRCDCLDRLVIRRQGVNFALIKSKASRLVN